MLPSCIHSNTSPKPCGTSSAKTRLIGASLTLLVGFTTVILPAHSSETLNTQSESVRSTVQPRSLSDGTYLYGQVAKADQIGQTYLVLQVRDRIVKGAIYEPFSSFDCLQGKVQANRLALTITNSYEQTQSPYAITLQTNSQVATAANPPLEAVKLAGFHQIQTLSSNDRRLLSICEAKNPTSMKPQ